MLEIKFKVFRFDANVFFFFFLSSGRGGGGGGFSRSFSSGIIFIISILCLGLLTVVKIGSF